MEGRFEYLISLLGEETVSPAVGKARNSLKKLERDLVRGAKANKKYVESGGKIKATYKDAHVSSDKFAGTMKKVNVIANMNEKQYKKLQGNLALLEKRYPVTAKRIKEYTEQIRESGTAIEKYDAKQKKMSKTIIDTKNKQIEANKIWKAGQGTHKYTAKLLEMNGEQYRKLTSRISETGDAQKIANDIRMKGFKALTPELKKGLAMRVKEIEAVRKSGITVDANTKKQHEAIMQLNDSLKKYGTRMGTVRRGLDGMMAGIKKAGMMFLTLLGPLFLVGAALRTVKQAADWVYQPFIKFEDALYELRKTANLTLNEMLDIGDAIKRIASYTPIVAHELAEIAATAGRLGIRGRADILKFTETIAKMATATVLSTDEAANALAKLSAAFDIPISTIDKLASSINELSNITASTSRDIVNAMTRVGASGRLLGFVAEDVAALSATLIDMGMAGERSGPFSEDTEILTENGWKLIKNLKIGDLLYTLNPKTDEIEIHPNENLVINEWTGKDMIHIKSKSIDLKVTPEHELWIQFNHQNEYIATPAKNVLPRRIVRFKRSAKWQGKNPSHITIPRSSYNYNKNAIEKNIPTDLFIKFIGMFLAEGNIHNNRKQIQISQNVDSPAYEEIKELHDELKKYGFNYGIQKDKRGHGKGRKFVISNKQLTSFMINLGLNEKSYNKYIPRFIKNLNSELLKDLIYYYFLGDGTKDSRFPNTTSFKLNSTSERLIDDFQEICLKAGYVGIKGKDRKNWSFVSIRNNKKLSFARPSYILNVQTARNKLNPQINTNSENQISIEQYEGKVYCPVVKNHIVYVRRNGRPVWCRQTRIRRAFTELARKATEIDKLLMQYYPNWGEVLAKEPTEALLIYLEYLKDLNNPIEATAEAMTRFGKVGGFAILSLSENIDELRKNLESVRHEMIYGSSLMREYAIAVTKTSSQLQIAANRAEIARQVFGEQLAPSLVWVKDKWADLMWAITGTTYAQERANKKAEEYVSLIEDIRIGIGLYEPEIERLDEMKNAIDRVSDSSKLLREIDDKKFVLGRSYIEMRRRASVSLQKAEVDLATSGQMIIDTNEAIRTSDERLIGNVGLIIAEFKSQGDMCDTLIEKEKNLEKATNNLNLANEWGNKIIEEQGGMSKEGIQASKTMAFYEKALSDAKYDLVDATIDESKQRLKGLDLGKDERIMHEGFIKDYGDIHEWRDIFIKDEEIETALATKRGYIWQKSFDILGEGTMKSIDNVEDLEDALKKAGWRIEEISGIAQLVPVDKKDIKTVEELNVALSEGVTVAEKIEKAFDNLWWTEAKLESQSRQLRDAEKLLTDEYYSLLGIAKQLIGVYSSAYDAWDSMLDIEEELLMANLKMYGSYDKIRNTIQTLGRELMRTSTTEERRIEIEKELGNLQLALTSKIIDKYVDERDVIQELVDEAIKLAKADKHIAAGAKLEEAATKSRLVYGKMNLEMYEAESDAEREAWKKGMGWFQDFISWKISETEGVRDSERAWKDTIGGIETHESALDDISEILNEIQTKDIPGIHTELLNLMPDKTLDDVQLLSQYFGDILENVETITSPKEISMTVNQEGFMNSYAQALGEMQDQEIKLTIKPEFEWPKSPEIATALKVTFFGEEETESLQSGGEIEKTGVYKLHRGEEVISAHEVRKYNKHDINVRINFVGNVPAEISRNDLKNEVKKIIGNEIKKVL